MNRRWGVVKSVKCRDDKLNTDWKKKGSLVPMNELSKLLVLSGKKQNFHDSTSFFSLPLWNCLYRSSDPGVICSKIPSGWANSTESCFLFMSSTTNSMPFLTKHLSCCGPVSCSLILDSKNGTNFFFLLYDFTEDSFLTQMSDLFLIIFSFLINKSELSPFHLKKAHYYGFSLAYLNWQHHYFCSLEPH